MAEQQELRKQYLWRTIIAAIAIGVIMIVFISVFKDENNADNYIYSILSALGCEILIAGASLSAGGFLGFIFGIPKIIQDSKARLKYNDNLVEISDWLTKIIVGVGLTQLYQIPQRIKDVGVAFQRNFGDDIWGRNAAIAIISYFFLLGFLMLYFWTKTDYSIIMKDLDDEINQELERELVREKEQNAAIEKEKQKVEEKLVKVNKNIELKDEDLEAISQTFQTAIKPNETMGDNDDPQKGRWGGNIESNGRKVSATVRETTYSSEYFVVSLIVSSTDSHRPLRDPVKFYLHDTFFEPERTIQVKNRTANLQLVAWGAFTVGIECDNGETKLEIDLAELPDAPSLFKER